MTAQTPTLWRASHNRGPNNARRPWFLFRDVGPNGSPEAMDDAAGRLRRFATWEAAQRAADKANQGVA